MVTDPLAMSFTPLRGGGASARAHVRTAFLYLGNGWTDCAEIWYVVRDQLARQLTQTKDGIHLHVHTCARADVPRFSYLGSCLTDCAEIR